MGPYSVKLTLSFWNNKFEICRYSKPWYCDYYFTLIEFGLTFRTWHFSYKLSTLNWKSVIPSMDYKVKISFFKIHKAELSKFDSKLGKYITIYPKRKFWLFLKVKSSQFHRMNHLRNKLVSSEIQLLLNNFTFD